MAQSISLREGLPQGQGTEESQQGCWRTNIDSSTKEETCLTLGLQTAAEDQTGREKPLELDRGAQIVVLLLNFPSFSSHSWRTSLSFSYSMSSN